MRSTRKEKPQVPRVPLRPRVYNVTYTLSIVYDGLGDVFGQRRSFSATELRQYQTV
jgi:hypothetical protein